MPGSSSWRHEGPWNSISCSGAFHLGKLNSRRFDNIFSMCKNLLIVTGKNENAPGAVRRVETVDGAFVRRRRGILCPFLRLFLCRPAESRCPGVLEFVAWAVLIRNLNAIMNG